MPVLEAMAAGVPVLTSNRSALPEVAGDAAVLVDPLNTEAMGSALRDLTGRSGVAKGPGSARQGAGGTLHLGAGRPGDLERLPEVAGLAIFVVDGDFESAQKTMILGSELDLAGGFKSPFRLSSVTSGCSSSSSAFSSLRLKPIVASSTRKTS